VGENLQRMLVWPVEKKDDVHTRKVREEISKKKWINNLSDVNFVTLKQQRRTFVIQKW
jgi:hypothetical protein